MSTFAIIITIVALVIYIIGVVGYVCGETVTNVEYHEGGFLGMGYTTNSNRETTGRDVRMGLIWPILLIIFFVKACIWLLNDLLGTLLLAIKIDYKNTRMYYWIDRTFNC